MSSSTLFHPRPGQHIRRGAFFPRALALVACALLLAASLSARAQSGAIQVRDTSALHPPPGARVAIVEWDDMECPACAHANPILRAAAEKYHIPWLRHDLLIPYHLWSRNAAIRARWFDAYKPGLGNEYRDQVFASQTYIYNLMALNQFTEKFAQQHGVAMPFAIDPQGKLAAMVDADTALGNRMGITQTPTIFIVTAGSRGAPYIQVTDPDRDLYRTIDQALADTTPTRTAHK